MVAREEVKIAMALHLQQRQCLGNIVRANLCERWASRSVRLSLVNKFEVNEGES